MQRFLLFTTAVLAICVVPSMGFMASRTCFCDLKEGSDANKHNLRMYLDLNDYIRRRFLFVRCRVMLEECRDKCLDYARQRLGVRSNSDILNLSSAGGQALCRNHGRSITPSNRKYLYLSYKPSDCGPQINEYMGELCCWRCSFPGNPTMFLFNQSCDQDNPLSTICN